MAIFVMAMGILSMAVLFPLGLRESNQGFADLKQSSFADYVLNQAVAAAQLPDVKWSEWSQVDTIRSEAEDESSEDLPDLPQFIKEKMDIRFDEGKFRIRCCRPEGYSGRRMVFVMQSTEMENLKRYSQYKQNPMYYAEAYFYGRPDDKE